MTSIEEGKGLGSGQQKDDDAVYLLFEARKTE